MSKHYEITVQAVATVYVAGAKNEEEAVSFAREVLDAGNFEDLTMQATELTTKASRESSKRHANAVSEG